jgi:Mrp family chromosome partitioning ATPase
LFVVHLFCWETNMSQSEKTSRRGILAAVGLGGVAAATVAVLPRQAAEVQGAVEPEGRSKPEKGGGYALTEHVKRYFRTTLV